MLRAVRVFDSLTVGVGRNPDKRGLFSVARPRGAPETAAPGPSAPEARLAEINPDDLTPKTALELLYELRRLLQD